MLARLWPGLDVLGLSQYVDLPAVRTVVVVVVVVAAIRSTRMIREWKKERD